MATYNFPLIVCHPVTSGPRGGITCRVVSRCNHLVHRTRESYCGAATIDGEGDRLVLATPIDDDKLSAECCEDKINADHQDNPAPQLAEVEICERTRARFLCRFV